MNALGALCLAMNFHLPSLAMSKDHGLRLLAIKQGLVSGQLSMPVLARQILGRALNGPVIDGKVVGEYKASLAALPIYQQRELFPKLTRAVRSEIIADGFGDRSLLVERGEALLAGLGLVPAKN